MTLQYNISNGQQGRPAAAGVAPRLGFGGAVAGSLALHAAAVALAVLAFSGTGTLPDASAAVTVFVEASAPPAASAEQVAAAITAPPAEELPPPTVPMLEEALPPPVAEAVAPPDFKPPPPPPQPPPKPVQATPRPSPVKPATAPKAGPSQSGQAATAEATAPAAAPAAAPSVAPGWNSLIAAWLAAHKRYPEEARRRSERGEVTIRFSVAADGKVLDVSVVRGSGSSALDTAALAMLRGATVPAPGSAQTRDVRIRYNLTD